MLVLLKAAWEGWQNYIDTGKYAALLLVVLLFLWFGNVKKQQRVLTIYTTLLVVCCVCPLSAVCLMLYQTRFYDYEWIWNYVPVTIMLAYGGVVFLAERWECYKREHKGSGKAHLWQHVGLCAMVAALIFLCGSMGRNVLANGEGEQYRTLSDAQSRANTQRILFEVIEGSHEYAEGQDICLWAPKDIMAAARAGQYNITHSVLN